MAPWKPVKCPMIPDRAGTRQRDTRRRAGFRVLNRFGGKSGATLGLLGLAAMLGAGAAPRVTAGQAAIDTSEVSVPETLHRHHATTAAKDHRALRRRGPAIAAQAARQSFELSVPRAPTPVTVRGERRLVYELHITSFASVDLILGRIEVLDPEASGLPLADFRNEQLAPLLGGPAFRTEGVDRRVIAPGMRAVAYFWVPLDPSGAVPRSLRHRITFREAAAGSEGVVEGGRTELPEEAPVAIGPPLRGGPWVAAYDPAMERGHRRVLFALDGHVRIPARFAIDWMKVGEDGRFARGDASRVANWHAYGAEVLAVADARVAAVRDSIDESPTVELVAHGLDKASGNYVTLELGGGRYISYEHLKPGSIRVRVGEEVRQGQVIAQVGNSGDSVGPHLHVHVNDGGMPLAGEGLPFVIRSFDVLGAYSSITAVGQEPWVPVSAGESETRRMELPAPNTVVDFGASAADRRL